MNTVDIIVKKKEGLELSKEELEYFFNGYNENTIPDYQMSSLLMAICLKDMTISEIFNLCDIFIKSGEVFDLNDLPGVKVDKHSTGGVGDKTTLIIGPIVASCGIIVPKISGKGLGHTGGTIDKLDSIDGFDTNLRKDEFINLLRKNSFAVTSQTDNLVLLDKKIYSLRDVTGTVESIPLIAVSIMSKKIALNADKILIDVKVGEGALIKNYNEALRIIDIMTKIGNRYNKEVRCIVNDMNNPLGKCIGNKLEVLEAIQVLQNKGDNYLKETCIKLASHMVSMGKNISYDNAKEEVIMSLENNEAYLKFLDFVKAQGGNINSLSIIGKKIEIRSTVEGKLEGINALSMGEFAVELGAGRKRKDENIDYNVGIIINKNIGDMVKKEEILCTVIYNEKIPDFSKLNEMFKII